MILGFAGKAASGKTTAAKHLASLIGGNTKIVPMAMVLREEVENFLARVDAERYIPLVYGSQEDKIRTFYVDRQKALDACPQWLDFIAEHSDIQDMDNLTAVTVRRILQWWGTEYRREMDPDYWTKAWARKVESFDLEKTHVLVDDIRFKNELNTLRDMHGLIVRIIRPGFNGAGNHASETSLDDFDGWDYEILNDGTLQKFIEKVSRLKQKLPL